MLKRSIAFATTTLVTTGVWTMSRSSRKTVSACSVGVVLVICLGFPYPGSAHCTKNPGEETLVAAQRCVGWIQDKTESNFGEGLGIALTPPTNNRNEVGIAGLADDFISSIV